MLLHLGFIFPRFMEHPWFLYLTFPFLISARIGSPVFENWDIARNWDLYQIYLYAYFIGFLINFVIIYMLSFLFKIKNIKK